MGIVQVLYLLGVAAQVGQATPVVVARAPPATFTSNPSIGPGGTTFTDSARFSVVNSKSASAAQAALNTLESAYTCFVDTLGWRSSGLSYYSDNDNGPYYRTNVYDVNAADLPGAAGTMGTESGYSFLNVVTQYMTAPSVFVHEYGHGLTYAERYWVDQGRTGAWWETTANWVADTFLTSDLCAAARTKYNQAAGATNFNAVKVIGDSFQVIVDGTQGSGNYYEAWPFFTYLTNNLDGFAGLGSGTFPGVFRNYSRNSNETPLHTLQRMSKSGTIQAVVGRYWARMAYVDIGHPKAQAVFQSSRSRINYANYDSNGSGKYTVKSARRPRYMGANITPLKGTGQITAAVTASAAYTATLVVRASSGAITYTNLVGGTATVNVPSGGEAMLVVANTPNTLLQFDPFALSTEANTGLSYSITLTGATV